MKQNIYCGLKMSVSLSLMRNKRGECAGTEGIFRSTGRFSSTAAAYIYLELIREGNSLMSRQKTIPSVSISVDFFFIQSHVCYILYVAYVLLLLETRILEYRNTRVFRSVLPETKKYVVMWL